MSQQITLVLAHPLSAEQAAKLRAKDVKDYAVGDKIVVSQEDARAIIGAGYAQVEPSDPVQVAAALKVPGPVAQAEPSTRGVAPSAASGKTTA